MQLNLETDYGIRCMLFLAEEKRCVTSVEMTEKLGFHTVEHTQKILRKLRDGGLVKVKLGSNGGYMLARDASEISVLEVLKAMEETICINRCLEPDGYCSRYATSYCPMHKYYKKVQRMMESVFAAATIQDIVDENFPEVPEIVTPVKNKVSA
ncbi:MAG: Rrf2 family transcriptional regulator [Lactimicrobium sp.]|jgi:Rrf2 family nitric oxide-sensitive transcriptional repressor|uniref:RrF2 family transcriptional regulator n=1 Tax=Lactimicrobium sp. TaxID=2563780 RepID=UPI002F35BF14